MTVVFLVAAYIEPAAAQMKVRVNWSGRRCAVAHRLRRRSAEDWPADRPRPHIKIAFFALGGWDANVNQGAVAGQLPNQLGALGESLSAFIQAMGPAYSDTIILVLSEFGRTFRENGNSGTDHGSGNVMWAMGGNIQGGKIYGQWPGPSGSELYDGRDLAVTTDFREIIAAVLQAHFGLTATQLAKLIPNGPRPSREIGGLMRL